MVRLVPSTAILLLLLAGPTAAQEESPGRPQPAVQATLATARVAMALRDFQPEPGPIELRSVAAEETIFVPLSSRVAVDRARLQLRYENSIALLPNRSQLQIRVNDAVVGQLPLSREQPAAFAEIELPADRLKPGFNEFSFRAAQHAVNGCEDAGSTELWTTIDAERSEILLDLRFLTLDPRLNQLKDLISPAIGGARKLNILTPDAAMIGQALDEDSLLWGALVAQAAALNLDFVAPQFTQAVARTASPAAAAEARWRGWRFPDLAQTGLAKRDQVLIGTRDQLAPLIGGEADNITNAYAGIFPLDADPTRFILIVSGTTAAEVTRAASALAIMDFPFTDAPRALINQLDIPQGGGFLGRVNVQEDQRYSFADLGLGRTTFRGRGPHRLTMDMVLPADLYAAETAEVEFDLSFAYGAGMRSDSVLNLYVNDIFERAIGLSEASGLAFRDYRLTVPLRSFKPGRNVLTLESVLVPSVSGDCTLIQDQNLLISIFEDSGLRMPPAARFAEQPDLNLLARTAFPAAGSDGGLVLNYATGDSDTAIAGWTLLAKLAQVAGRPILDLAVEVGGRKNRGNLLAIGAVDAIDEGLLAAAPIPLGQPNNVPYGLVQVETPSAPDSGGIPLFGNLLASLAGRQGSTRNLAVQRILQTNDLGEIGLLQAFERPDNPGRTAILLTARTPRQLAQLAGRLVTPPYWTQLRGDVALWTTELDSIATRRIGARFAIGKAGLSRRVTYFAAVDPLRGLIIVASLFAALSLLTWILVKHIHRRRLRTDDL